MAADNKIDVSSDHVSPTAEVRLPPIGFWSYGRQDDELSQGKLSTLRSLLMFELQQQHGRDKIHIFQDARTIQHGAAWEREIKRALLKATFFIPVITPNFVQSDWCCREVILFLEREAELQQLHPDLLRRSRIFPIHFIGIDDVDAADPTALAALQSRQWFDFRKFRHRSYESEEVREAIADLAGSIRDLLKIKTAPVDGEPARPPPPSRPMEDAREREAAAKAERRRREAEAEREAAARRLKVETQEAAAEAERRRRETEAAEAAAELERAAERERQATEDGAWFSEEIVEADEEIDTSQRLKRWVAIGMAAVVATLGLILWLTLRTPETAAASNDHAWLYGLWCELDPTNRPTTSAWEIRRDGDGLLVYNSRVSQHETIRDFTPNWVTTEIATYISNRNENRVLVEYSGPRRIVTLGMCG